MNNIKKSLTDKKISISNVVNVIVKTVAIVEKYKCLNGMEKKNLVIKVISRLIDDSKLNEDDQKSLMEIVEKTGYQIIDAIIFVSKGKLFDNIFKKTKKWFSSCRYP